MSENNSPQNVLDTFKFYNQTLFLKKFHIDRTFEALKYINTLINKSDVTEIYDQIEKKYSAQVSKHEVLRIVFHNQLPLNYEIQVKSLDQWPQCPTLQLVTALKQKSGLGIQNYKWVEREFWSKLFEYKNKDSHDVIALNDLNQITETSRCNIYFYEKKTDQVLTPSLETGCLHGVYRRHILQDHKINLPDLGPKKVIEFNIDPKLIKNYEIYIANSIREVVKAKLFKLE